MILQNIAKAIREQNYYAVLLEFVIVIAGVVIGFQIQAWNQDRADRENEGVYLERLHQDLVQSVCSLRRDVRGVSSWNTRAQRTLDALLNNDPEAEDDSGFELIASTRVLTGSLFRATLNELVNGGQMNLIADDGLRAQIAEADATFAQLADLIDILVAAQGSFLRDVHSRLRPVPGESHGITYDFEALAEDEVFLNALGHALRITHQNILWLEEMTKTADELRVAVAKKVGDSTEPLDCKQPGAGA